MMGQYLLRMNKAILGVGCDVNRDVGDDDKFLNANAEEGLAGCCAKHLSYSPATHIV